MKSNMIQMKLTTRLYLLMIKVNILGTSCTMCAYTLGEYPYSITRVQTRTPKGRKMIVMF